jgi:hypothetical protein
MYMPMTAAAMLLPLLHPTGLSGPGAQLQPVPIIVSGVACASPRDMVGIYETNVARSATTVEALLTMASEAGYRCQLFTNNVVYNWGPAGGPHGAILIPGAQPVPIIEVVDPTVSPATHYFLVSRTR